MENQVSKSVFLSKTMWANLIMALGAVFASKWPAVNEYVNEVNVAYLFTFVNMVLRLVTKDRLYFSEK